MIRQNHHLISNVLHFLAGGALSLIAASLCNAFGWRSADRLPGENRWPQCVYCLKTFSWQEISPLFGWLLRSDTFKLPCPCGKRTGLWPQPVVELIAFALGVIGIYLSGWSLMAAPLCLGLGVLASIAMVDLHFGIIPDGLNLLVALLGILWIWLSGGDIYMALIIASSLLAVGLFCALVYSRWRGKEMLGLGDVKFFAAAGLWLQPEIAPWFLALAGFIGAIIGIVWKRVSGNEQSPFAPALCISLIICVLYQLIQMP